MATKSTQKAARLTREQAAIIGAFTGVCCGPFGDIQEYAQKVLDRPIWTHQFAEPKVCDELRDASRVDFMALCFKEGE